MAMFCFILLFYIFGIHEKKEFLLLLGDPVPVCEKLGKILPHHSTRPAALHCNGPGRDIDWIFVYLSGFNKKKI